MLLRQAMKSSTGASREPYPIGHFPMTTIRFRRGTAAQWSQVNPVLASGEPGFETDTGKQKIGDGAKPWSQLDYFLDRADSGEEFVPRDDKEVVAGTSIHYFRLDTASGGQPFQQIYRSFPNPAPGTSRNDAMWFGFGASWHAQDGSAEAGNGPSVYMGFESSWFDPSDGTQGPEWYTGYLSPDGTTVGVADLRPLYWRVLNGTDNSRDKSVIVHADIGSGSSGQFTVWGGVIEKPIFYVRHHASFFRNHLVAASGLFTVQNQGTGGAAAIVDGDLGSYAELAFRLGGANSFGFRAVSENSGYFVDKTERPFLVFTYGASVLAALVDMRSTVKVRGGFAVNNASPVTTQSVPPAATDPASTQALVNSLREALVNYGFIA